MPNFNFTTYTEPICRILPAYVADNFEEFFILTVPVRLPKITVTEYVLRLKKKIACFKREMSV